MSFNAEHARIKTRKAICNEIEDIFNKISQACEKGKFFVDIKRELSCDEITKLECHGFKVTIDNRILWDENYE